MMDHKILFILKRREDYKEGSYSESYCNTLSTGLWNSARLVHEMLVSQGIESNLEAVTDNNDIDRLVSLYKPTDVIIEALWVVPEKFAILTKLHPNVRWIVRTHSESPFIAMEGMAMTWLLQYLKHDNVSIAVNSTRFLSELRFLLGEAHPEIDDIHKRIVYLPNYYPVAEGYPEKPEDAEYIDIGCFGATRPMKNQLIQAHAAIRFAAERGKKLRFHINGNRIEQQSDSIMKNLRNLFAHLSHCGHELVLHPWMHHDEFINTIKTLDIGMQVSFSETFNIVTADFVANGVPVLASPEVYWLPEASTANPTDESDIVDHLEYVYDNREHLTVINKHHLYNYSVMSTRAWSDFFHDLPQSCDYGYVEEIGEVDIEYSCDVYKSSSTSAYNSYGIVTVVTILLLVASYLIWG